MTEAEIKTWLDSGKDLFMQNQTFKRARLNNTWYQRPHRHTNWDTCTPFSSLALGYYGYKVEELSPEVLSELVLYQLTKSTT